MDTIVLDGWRHGMKRGASAQLLHRSGVGSLAEAARLIDRLVDGPGVEIPVPEGDDLISLLERLRGVGFKARAGEPGPSHVPVSRDADLRVEIRFIESENGGRSGPVFSGYYPDHDLGLPDQINGARHEYPHGEWVYPGDTTEALLWLTAPDSQIRRLSPGQEITVQEGARVVALGTIKEVLNPNLVVPSNKSLLRTRKKWWVRCAGVRAGRAAEWRDVSQRRSAPLRRVHRCYSSMAVHDPWLMRQRTWPRTR